MTLCDIPTPIEIVKNMIRCTSHDSLLFIFKAIVGSGILDLRNGICIKNLMELRASLRHTRHRCHISR
jgi:hypothetical protein